jgi:hypothetical protein
VNLQISNDMSLVFTDRGRLTGKQEVTQLLPASFLSTIREVCCVSRLFCG